MDTLAKRFQRTRSSMYRVINEIRAQRLLEQPLDYIYHDSLRRPGPGGRASWPACPDAEAFEASRRQMRIPKDAPPELASLYEMPLLDQGAGTAPVPQDELPQVPGQPSCSTSCSCRAAASTRRAPHRRTSTRSRSCWTRPTQSRTCSSTATCGWWCRSPSGTPARPTTSSSCSPTATCR